MSFVRAGSTLLSFVPFLGLVLATGCAGGTGAPAAEPAAAPLQAAQGTDGLTLFADHCGECHTVDPPGGTAPPMRTVMRAYAREYATSEDLRAALVFWLRYPDAEWAAMPNKIIETHGVMPAQDLTLEQVEGIVDFLLSL